MSKGSKWKRIFTLYRDFDAERFLAHLRAHNVDYMQHGAAVMVARGDWPLAVHLKITGDWSRELNVSS